MPRLAPDQVTEHRITLGNWERDKIQTVEDAITNTAKATTIASLMAGSASIMLPVGVGVAGLGIGAGLYYGLREFTLGDGDLIRRMMGKGKLGQAWAKSQAQGETTSIFVAKQMGNAINDSVFGKVAKEVADSRPEPLNQRIVREFIDLIL